MFVLFQRVSIGNVGCFHRIHRVAIGSIGWPSDPLGGRHNVLIGPSHTHMGPAGVSPYRGPRDVCSKLWVQKTGKEGMKKNLSVFEWDDAYLIGSIYGICSFGLNLWQMCFFLTLPETNGLQLNMVRRWTSLFGAKGLFFRGDVLVDRRALPSWICLKWSFYVVAWDIITIDPPFGWIFLEFFPSIEP